MSQTEDSGARLLLIEDSPSDARLLEAALRNGSFTPGSIALESTLAGALERLAHDEFDAVLVDLGLPDSDGIETFTRVAQAAGRAAVIVVTGLRDMALGEQAVRLGAQDYLSKTERRAGDIGRAVAFAIGRQDIRHELGDARQRQIEDNDTFLSHVSDGLQSPISVVHRFASLLFDGAAGPLSLIQRDFLGVLMSNVAQLQTAETAMRAAQAEAERANAAKSEFLSRMSHELRTPLNAVLGFAQLLELEELSEDQSESVGHILRGGRHLLELINDVLDIAKIESDQVGLSPEPIPIRELLADTLELITPMADAARVGLHQEVGGAEYLVFADRRRLRQVLLNLLSNAIKYNVPGGRVDVRATEITPSVIDIVVQDTGIGIRAQDLPRLFTSFDRLGVEVRGIEGSGVGLALSRRLMNLMAGELRASSQAGVGTTFTASLPKAQTTNPTTSARLTGGRPTATLVGPEAAEPIGTRTVLYIEDNLVNIALMEQVFRHRPDWQLVIVTDGEQGLELARAEPPALVLLDLHLPDMAGVEVLRQLRADARTGAVPVVVVSADANTSQRTRLLEAGAHEYLTKPIAVDLLLEVLDRVVEVVTL